MREYIAVGAIWIRTARDEIQVLVKAIRSDGTREFRKIWSGHRDQRNGETSHIVEVDGIESAPKDDL